jgi:HEAT repeat protein
MDSEEAIESLLSILTTSKNLENKVKAAEKMLNFNDKDKVRFQSLTNVFLNDRHPQLRIQLIELLAEWYGKEGIKFLKDHYKDCSDGSVRTKLIESVGNIDLNGSISFFIEVLGDPNIEAKKLAIIILGKTNSNKVISPLVDQLHFRNAEIYDTLINSIVKIGKKGNLVEINNFIGTDDISIKREIPLILGKIGDKKSETNLIEFLKDKNPIIRKNTVKALEKIIDSRNLKYILEALNDSEQEVRKESIQVLGKIGNKRALNPLLDLLKDNDLKVRNNAKNAIYKILKKSNTNDVLYNVLKGRNINARREAIKLLGMLKDTNAIDLIIKTFDSTVASIRGAAFRATSKILQNKVDERIINALSARSWRRRMFCTKILGAIGDPNTLEYVYKLIEDENGSVRQAVIEALTKFNTDKVINIAKGSLESPNWKTRRAGVKLFMRIGNKDSINALVSCLTDEDVYIKSWAAMALGKLKNVDSIEPFIQLLKETDSKIRISSAKALGDIGTKEAIKPLVEALGDDNWDVRKEVENALNRIDPDWMSNL